MKEIDKAVELLKPLLKCMAKERNCTVSVMATDINKFPFITKANMKFQLLA